MTCPKCGANNIDGSILCVSCGTNFKEINAQSVSEAPVQAKPNTNLVNSVDSAPNLMSPEPSTLVSQSSVPNLLSPEPETMVQSTPDLMGSEPSVVTLQQTTSDAINSEAGEGVTQSSAPDLMNNMSSGVEQPQATINSADNTQVNNLNNNGIKNKKNLFIVLGALAVITIVAGLGFKFLSSADGGAKSSGGSLDSSTAFFIKNNAEKYALFNVDGKQLTEFEFDSYTDFISGHAVVKKGYDYGVINENGKMTINFGKYDYVYKKSAFFEVVDSENNEFLVDSKGKVLYDLKGNSVHTSSYSDGDDNYLLLETEKDYKVLNYKGKTVISFKKVDDDDDPLLDNKEKYATVFYNNVNYIIDTESGKLILQFNDNRNFNIGYINPADSNEFSIVAPHGSDDYNSEDALKDFKYVKNGKVVYEVNASDYNNIVFNERGVVEAYSLHRNSIVALLSEKGEVAVDLSKGTVQYYDSKNYALSLDDFGHKPSVYNEGKLVKTIDCARMPTGDRELKHKIYKFQGCGGEFKFQYYKEDGTLLTDTYFSSAGDFDDNGRVVVSEGSKIYYLMDTNGKKVSNDYASISNIHYGITDNVTKYYIVQKQDNTYAVTDENDNEIMTSNEKIYAHDHDDTVLLILKEDETYSVYDINKKKIISENLSESPYMGYKNYFTVKVESKTQYYSYSTGKMFYEG